MRYLPPTRVSFDPNIRSEVLTVAQVRELCGPVTEIDPTGAGDAFCGGFTVTLPDGLNLGEAGRFANAVGALAVTKLGPMKGAFIVKKCLTSSRKMG